MKTPQGLLIAVGVACLGTLIAGLLPAAAADSTDAYVPAGKVESLLLSADEIGDVLGVTFEWQKDNRRPYKSDDLGKDSACALLTGPDVETFGRDYTGYRFQADRDKAEKWEFTVQQRVAAYADSDAVTQAFGKAFNKGVMAKCNGTVATNKDTDVQWRFRIKSISPTGARWTEDQLVDDEPIGYGCSNVAGVARNVLYSVKVCQYGNGGPAAATMAERIATQVAGVRV
ncbi:sensor domain-containing protein [[Mycobacterium] nativiensis]|uniref:Sensor domain-containing protein n=1 Tax=[Mycobacterium] nativiensis TaxID=2855503 RepID=A0ABU5Y159_9MYCO|nr:sensor domain-containing protein [Mycolicibacter sp. MYC340]MEB3033963.1 sensor domain-containing protein [Mycolicibacter sp. MYC340]